MAQTQGDARAEAQSRKPWCREPPIVLCAAGRRFVESALDAIAARSDTLDGHAIHGSISDIVRLVDFDLATHPRHFRQATSPALRGTGVLAKWRGRHDRGDLPQNRDDHTHLCRDRWSRTEPKTTRRSCSSQGWTAYWFDGTDALVKR
jgi:hypothetical protein